ncbi:MAG: helix-turn-helix domain-containing protein [Bacteroidota bacterium]
MNIGTVITQIRKEKKISQKELSRLSSISQTYISQIEAGNRNPTLDVLQSIGDVLGVPYQVIAFLSLDEDSIPEAKKAQYKLIEPTIKALIEKHFISK